MKYLVLLLFLNLGWKGYSQEIPSAYKVYDTRKKAVVSLEQVVAAMDHADVLFFGEEHNDSIGHFLEVQILQKIHERFPKRITLSLEMFATDVQVVLDEYLAQAISEKNFLKDSRSWSNYQDYRPLIEYAKIKEIPVIAANAAARYSNAVSLGGLMALKAFPKSSLSFLPPLPIDTAKGPYFEKFNVLLGAHNMGHMKIYQTQNLWDASMAWSIAKYLTSHHGNKVFQINGRFHSDEQLGTIAKLKQYSPKLKILNISCFPDETFNLPDWNKWNTLGDFVIITKPQTEIK